MGDSEDKLSKYGGIHNVVSAIPDVICFNLDEDIDFLLLGCKLFIYSFRRWDIR